MFVCDLARKNPNILKQKSQLYLWNLLTVAVFYSLPVLQLVITYQKVSLSKILISIIFIYFSVFFH